MIPQAHITAWRETAPWADDAQVEQDLVLSRAVVEVFAEPELAGALVLRGGTALNKLFIQPPSRYSQDIDLVEGFSVMKSNMTGLSLPKNWPQGVKAAVLHVIALARVAIIHARRLAVNGPDARTRRAGDLQGALDEIAMLE